MASLFQSIRDSVEEGVENLFGGDKSEKSLPQQTEEQQGRRPSQPEQTAQVSQNSQNRYGSFAPQTSGNVKWHVDGASYFWAVSMALEAARESIYILDWWLSPELYLRRPPARNQQYRLDTMLKAAAERGVRINIIVYKEVPQALTLNSEHTKQVLEGLHSNIKVFRHPDHYPRGIDFGDEITSSFQDLSLRTFDLAKISGDALKTLYGTTDDVVLYWAHHEKLCVVDDKIAFMGGLDMCFGRWDTNSHPIADAHPGDLGAIVFPGQDFNNARVYDFEEVNKWEHNKLDRTKSSRMGWSDISISLSGPIVSSLLAHFVDRWNYIFDDKYESRDEKKYARIEAVSGHLPPSSGARIQLTRSPWSSGHPTEHSIADAYIEAITNAQHFVYIENQFFITATSKEQEPVENKIGLAIVNRIRRAHERAENFQIIVLMPAVPAFAGDLKSDGALGTRAIMEFQYNSINRGGHSIIESLQQAGVPDPYRYINFYNLRNYDRINTSSTMAQAERESGVSYESARREQDDRTARSYGDGYQQEQEQESRRGEGGHSQYQRYQEAASRASDQTYDSIAACYMASGPDLDAVPWQGSAESELDAFVSEELYIHSKVLIADDRLVICGSANLNDRSQLGDHDSEIAVVIEDPTPVEASMGGQSFTASAFAASLRRQLFRKHLGLLPHQPVDAFGPNWTPVTDDGNEYDWGSEADRLVADPLDARFRELWTGTARRNTEAFSRAFHPVPNDKCRTWEAYDDFFSRRFVLPGEEEEKAKEGYQQGKVDYGHVVRDEFPGGIRELKECLSQIRGTLVEMPLQFLIEVPDLAKEGLSLNGLTDTLYT